MQLLLLVVDDELRAGLGIAGDKPTDDPLPIVLTMLPAYIFAFPFPPAKALEPPGLDELALPWDDGAASTPLLRFIPISSCC